MESNHPNQEQHPSEQNGIPFGSPTQNNQPPSGPPGSEESGTVPNDTEQDGTMQNETESFRSIPHNTEFNQDPEVEPEKTENHTLTVRKVVRMFEDAGVTRSERCITKWCKPNRDGVAKLNCFLDEEARRYYITPESVRIAIKEEQEKARDSASVQNSSEQRPNASTSRYDFGESTSHNDKDAHPENVKQLQAQIRDLEITNKAKDYHIEKVEREHERMFEALLGAKEQIGHLNEQLLQLGSGTGVTKSQPSQNSSARLGIEDEFDSHAA